MLNAGCVGVGEGFGGGGEGGRGCGGGAGVGCGLAGGEEEGEEDETGFHGGIIADGDRTGINAPCYGTTPVETDLQPVSSSVVE